MDNTILANPENRILSFEGAVNFRDLGGYRSFDGRRVKRNLFFRSDKLTNLTEKDLAYMQALNIKYILDYRDEQEAFIMPDPILDSVINERIPIEASGAFKQYDSLEDLFKSGFFKEPKTIDELYGHFYATLPINNPAYKRLMQVIQAFNNQGILQHCAAGKDRTGFGSALILLALGVSKEVVMEDYLISNEAFKGVRQNIVAKASSQLDENAIRALEAYIGVKEEYLESAFKTIRDHYGTFDNYFKSEFGLTKEKQKVLQDFYLE